MNLHEFQAKQLFAAAGVPVPIGRVARSIGEAREAAKVLGGDHWVVKAQVQAGGRGKAGGVKRVAGVSELEACVNNMLGTMLVTHQTTAQGLPVHAVLVEEPCSIAQELYLSALVDRASGRVAFIASAVGGMDIEQVASSQPDKILKVLVDPVAGLQPYQCRQIGFGLGLPAELIKSLTSLMLKMYRLFVDRDLSLVEINPLVITSKGELLALDAKINVDENALYRQVEMAGMRDATQEDETEYKAQQHGLNYVTLDGNIGCMVNGAGLAMATMDLIKLHGGEPANFLDVGGGTTAARVAEAFKLIVADGKIKAILVNIFGGIVRCDLIAEGIIQALREVQIKVPVVARLEGTNAAQGLAMLDASGLAIMTAEDLADAARKAVAAASGG